MLFRIISSQDNYSDETICQIFPLLDALVAMEKAMKRDKIEVNDRQLACAHISSQEGQDYLKSMAAAANFAWVNRSSMTFLTRQVGFLQDMLQITQSVAKLLN